MIHGFGLTYNIWRKLKPALLAAGLQLIMVELPGMGASPQPGTSQDYNRVAAERLLGLRRHLDLRKWDVLAYSAGTRTGDVYIASDAAAVGRVVYICPIQMRLDQWLGLNLISGVDAAYPVMGNWVLSGARFEALLTYLSFSGRRLPEVRDWHSEITAQPPEMLKTTLRSLLPYRLRPLRASGKPLRRIWGRSDLLARPPLFPGPEDIIIPGDHSAPTLAAERVAPLVIEFLV